MANKPYSFVNYVCSISGPNGAFNIGYGAGVGEEGISWEFIDEDSTSTTGADASLMHSINASKTATITITLLKTSPTNNLLMTMRNQDKSNPATAGQNVIKGRDIVRGDEMSATQVAFKKVPTLSYGKTAGMNVWTFTGIVDEILGAGL